MDAFERVAVCKKECYWLHRRWVPGDTYTSRDPEEKIAKGKIPAEEGAVIPHHFVWADEMGSSRLEKAKTEEGEFAPPMRKRVGRGVSNV